MDNEGVINMSKQQYEEIMSIDVVEYGPIDFNDFFNLMEEAKNKGANEVVIKKLKDDIMIETIKFTFYGNRSEE